MTATNKTTPERRRLPQPLAGAAVRAAEGSPRVIHGHAAVFYNPADPGTQIELWGDTFERIMPGAFSRAIAERQDVRGLFNHSPDWLLGRTSSGTCRLTVDARGLYYEIDESPTDPQWLSVAAKAERGDLTGSSFTFIPRKTVWIDRPDGTAIREIHDVDLYDVGPVTFPWYESADSQLRSSGMQQQELVSLRAALEAERKAFGAPDLARRERVLQDLYWRQLQHAR